MKSIYPLCGYKILKIMESSLDEGFSFAGTWSGTECTVINAEGTEVMKYRETIEIKLVKTKPVNVYMITSSTYTGEDGSTPVHFETGFIKFLPGDATEGQKIEANFAHPFGICEYSYGTYKHAFRELELEATKDTIFRGKSAKGKTTTGFRRCYQIDENGDLTYKMYLGVDGNEPYFHLAGTLKKSAKI